MSEENRESLDVTGGGKPGKRERILVMFIHIFRAILRFFERRMMKARSRRLAKRMDRKS